MRSSLATALALVLLLASPGCGGPVVDVIVAALVDTFDFDVEIALSGDADPATLIVTLNGEDITSRFAPGGAGMIATLEPGAPLLDANQIVANVDDMGGTGFQAQADFDYLPPKARLFRITDESDLLSGPLAHGRIGDWRMDNAVAAFIIQDVGKRELNATATFGGNLIDAVRLDDPMSGPGAGLDHVQEVQPMANIETVLNAQHAEIVNDGQDGTAAILRVTGPDDAWDYLNISNFLLEMGLSLPAGTDDTDQPVVGETLYILEPGAIPSVRMDTTWTDIRHPDDPTNSGGNIPMYVGDMIAEAGELDEWIPSFGLGEVQAYAALPSAGGPVPDLFRTKYTLIGDRGAIGASYGLIPVELPGSPFETTTFSVSGVTTTVHSISIPFVLQFGTPAVFVVPESGSNTYSRYFAVGTGDGASIMQEAHRIFDVQTGTVQGCLTVGGVPAGPGADVVLDVDDGIARVDIMFQTREDGCYSGEVPTGDYLVGGHVHGALYEGGGPAPIFHPITVNPCAVAVQDIPLPATGRLRVVVTDENDQPTPARVSVLGSDPSPPVSGVFNIGFGPFLLGTFEQSGFDLGDPEQSGDDDSFGRDGLLFAIAQLAWIDGSGVVEFPIEPGDYTVAVSRGTEYSLRTHDVSVAAGETEVVETQIARVVDSGGFISSDYHVHLAGSTDSPISREDRVLSMAGEGVENIIVTEHHCRTPLGNEIAALGLVDFVNFTLGEEITTSDTGHYNGYPMDLLEDVTCGGTTDWGGAAPPGEDFSTLGSFVLPPSEIYELVQTSNSSPNVVTQINHIGSHFEPLLLDTALVPPASGLTPAQLLAARLDPASGNLFHYFDALELWNGADAGAQDNFLLERIGIWMNHLNQGLVITAIADTDTHTFHDLKTAGARTWTPSSSDAPADIDPEEVAQAVHRGRAVGGQGVYVQTRLVADSTESDTGFGLGDPLIAVDRAGVDRLVPGLTTSDGQVHLDIHVQAPLWAPYDTIEIYTNTIPDVSLENETNPPTLYTAVPDMVLTAGLDFTVDEIDPYAPAPIPQARRLETHHRQTLNLAADTWIVVVVKGSEDVSTPMFPVFPRGLQSPPNVDPDTGQIDLAALADGNLGEGGTLALGFTNALYVDTDGDGAFDPPVQAGAP